MMRFKLLIILLLSFFCIFRELNAQAFEMPGYINDISSCDFDGDSFVDIIVSCSNSDSIIILFNDGIGNFNIIYYNRICGSFIPCGLIDSDTLPDLVTGSSDGISIIRNLGQRNLGENQTIMETTGNLEVKKIIDINLDSLNDLVYTYTSGEYWGIIKNNGDLSFSNEIIQSGSSTTYPGVGLITDDSLPDVVLTYSEFNRSSVNVNNGNFDFTEIVLEDSFIGEAFVMNIDNQGTDDFAFANYYTNTIPLYEFIGENQFELHNNYHAPGTYTVASFLADDFDQDGYDDFIISRCNWYDCTDSIYIYFNDQNWSFYETQRVYVGYLGFFNLKSADLNGDSFPDLYMSGVGTNGNKTLKILWNDGTGNFSYENPVFIKDLDAISNSLKVCPNPFHDHFNIEFSQTYKESTDIFFVDLYGNTVKSFIDIKIPDKQPISINWDGTDDKLEQLPKGIYMLIIRSKSYQISKKMIKY